MLLHCNSKKCNTTRDHKLKDETNEVVCMDCGEINASVNTFMKQAMRNAGDLYRSVKSRKAFMYKCTKCNTDRGVKVIDEQARCEVCQQPFNLSGPMLEAIKYSFGSSKSVDDKEEEVVPTQPKPELSKGAVKRRKTTQSSNE
jgi:hypothetical protein